MENVFTYFVAIGSGLTLGVAIVVIPAIWILKKMNQKGENKLVRTK